VCFRDATVSCRFQQIAKINKLTCTDFNAACQDINLSCQDYNLTCQDVDVESAVGMLNEIQKTGFWFEKRNPVLQFWQMKFEFIFSIFVKKIT